MINKKILFFIISGISFVQQAHSIKQPRVSETFKPFPTASDLPQDTPVASMEEIEALEAQLKLVNAFEEKQASEEKIKKATSFSEKARYREEQKEKFLKSDCFLQLTDLATAVAETAQKLLDQFESSQKKLLNHNNKKEESILFEEMKRSLLEKINPFYKNTSNLYSKTVKAISIIFNEHDKIYYRSTDHDDAPEFSNTRLRQISHMIENVNHILRIFAHIKEFCQIVPKSQFESYRTFLIERMTNSQDKDSIKALNPFDRKEIVKWGLSYLFDGKESLLNDKGIDLCNQLTLLKTELAK